MGGRQLRTCSITGALPSSRVETSTLPSLTTMARTGTGSSPRVRVAAFATAPGLATSRGCAHGRGDGRAGPHGVPPRNLSPAHPRTPTPGTDTTACRRCSWRRRPGPPRCARRACFFCDGSGGWAWGGAMSAVTLMSAAGIPCSASRSPRRGAVYFLRQSFACFAARPLWHPAATGWRGPGGRS